MVSNYIKRQRYLAAGFASGGFALLCLILEIAFTPPKQIDLQKFDGVVQEQYIRPGMGRRPPSYHLTLQSDTVTKNFSVASDYLDCLGVQLDLKPGDIVHAKISTFRSAEIWELSENNKTFFTYDQMHACVQKYNPPTAMAWSALVFAIISVSIFIRTYIFTRETSG